jgi:CRISPR-associated protein Cas1
MLNEVDHCPRLFHLEYLGREWEDGADTVSGPRAYRRVATGRS